MIGPSENCTSSHHGASQHAYVRGCRCPAAVEAHDRKIGRDRVRRRAAWAASRGSADVGTAAVAEDVEPDYVNAFLVTSGRKRLDLLEAEVDQAAAIADLARTHSLDEIAAITGWSTDRLVGLWRRRHGHLEEESRTDFRLRILACAA